MSLAIPTIPTLHFESQKAARSQLTSLFDERHTGIAGPLLHRLIGIVGERPLLFEQRSTIIFAGSHQHRFGNPAGDRQAVSTLLSTPSPVQMLAEGSGAELKIIDVGLSDLEIKPDPTHLIPLTNLRIGQTGNMAHKAPLSLPEVQDAIWVGMNIASQEIANRLQLLNAGYIGAGSGLAAAAIAAVVLDRPVKDFMRDEDTLPPQTQSQTRSDPKRAAAQIELVESALALTQPEREDPLDILRCAGGTEIGALVGLYLTAAAGGRPILINDFVTAAAALLATRLAPPLRSYLIASQATDHPGHQIILRHLKLSPILATNMRSGLGEAGLLAAETIANVATSYSRLLT